MTAVAVGTASWMPGAPPSPYWRAPTAMPSGRQPRSSEPAERGPDREAVHVEHLADLNWGQMAVDLEECEGAVIERRVRATVTNGVQEAYEAPHPARRVEAPARA